ncbi:unnamed protein product [Paramecium sonneborni]|uniref:Uncharacterized protein n=1 Tax=Paramecium sonneborni TaxID=65129 RepID=A0A8S1N3J0_9CILI|nr:unnamed protein product [Paramecium sonneborni]
MNTNQNEILFRLSEEQKKKLHELHLIQQRELNEMIRRHQQEQLQIFEQLKEQQETQQNQTKNLFSQEIKQSNLKYKPYTLSQYKLLKLQPILKNIGQGLGPTLSLEKWEESKDKMDRMFEFAEHVKLEHRQFKRKIPKSQPKQITARQRGLEFAKSVLKPILVLNESQKVDKLTNSSKNNELLEYELRNKILRQQIEKIK